LTSFKVTLLPLTTLTAPPKSSALSSVMSLPVLRQRRRSGHSYVSTIADETVGRYVQFPETVEAPSVSALTSFKVRCCH